MLSTSFVFEIGKNFGGWIKWKYDYSLLFFIFDEMNRSNSSVNTIELILWFYFLMRSVEDIEAFEWMVCDSNREEFGERIDDDLID